VSVFVKVVVDTTWKLPPTKYVPGGSVDEVKMFVCPSPLAALVLVFKTTGGRSAFTADGATMYEDAVEVIW
jgi:hypothetical protein